jgi:hypothetical protein
LHFATNTDWNITHEAVDGAIHRAELVNGT